MIVGHIEQTESESGYAPVLREAIAALRNADWSAKRRIGVARRRGAEPIAENMLEGKDWGS